MGYVCMDLLSKEPVEAPFACLLACSERSRESATARSSCFDPECNRNEEIWANGDRRESERIGKGGCRLRVCAFAK